MKTPQQRKKDFISRSMNRNKGVNIEDLENEYNKFFPEDETPIYVKPTFLSRIKKLLCIKH